MFLWNIYALTVSYINVIWLNLISKFISIYIVAVAFITIFVSEMLILSSVFITILNGISMSGIYLYILCVIYKLSSL